MTDRESGVWVSTISPLDPKIMKENNKVLDKIYETVSEFLFCY